MERQAAQQARLAGLAKSGISADGAFFDAAGKLTAPVPKFCVDKRARGQDDSGHRFSHAWHREGNLSPVFAVRLAGM